MHGGVGIGLCFEKERGQPLSATEIGVRPLHGCGMIVVVLAIRHITVNSSLDTSGYDSDAFDRGTDPVLRMFSVDQTQEIIDYQGDERLRAD
jgi:hypothetical protein